MGQSQKSLIKGAVFQLIYRSDTIDFLLTLSKDYLKKIRYQRDTETKGLLIQKEELYRRVKNREEWDRYQSFGQWIEYKSGKRYDNYIVYRCKQTENLFKIVTIVNVEIGPCTDKRRYASFYKRINRDEME